MDLGYPLILWLEHHSSELSIPYYVSTLNLLLSLQKNGLKMHFILYQVVLNKSKYFPILMHNRGNINIV